MFWIMNVLRNAYPNSISASEISRIIHNNYGVTITSNTIASIIFYCDNTDIVITHGHPNKYSIMR